MSYINIHEIKARFSHYAKLVARGQEFIIANRNTPFAVLSPIKKNIASKLTVGLLQGKFIVPDDFNAPLSEFERDYYS